MKIVIGCIVRNRAWILPKYLGALEEMRVPFEREYRFLENDSEDSTLIRLAHFCGQTQHIARVASLRTGIERWDHHQYDYANMAYLRNRLVEWFLSTEADFFMSVDSDVIVQTDTFEKLFETHQRTGGIVGAPICNVADGVLDGHTPGNFMVIENGALRHPTHYPLTGELEVDLTGAVYLIPREVFERGARYGEHPQGEDVPFCEAARAMGCPIHMNMDAVCEHRMRGGMPHE